MAKDDKKDPQTQGSEPNDDITSQSGAQKMSEEDEKKKKEEERKRKEEEVKVRKEMGFSDDFLGDNYTPLPGDFTDDKKQQIRDFKIGTHETKFDEKKFKDLLAESISLSFNEKMQILKAIPKLSQFQVDELMNILEEEQVKLKDLNKKHADAIKEFEGKKAAGNWDAMAAKADEQEKKEAEQAEIDKLKDALDDV